MYYISIPLDRRLLGTYVYDVLWRAMMLPDVSSTVMRLSDGEHEAIKGY